MRVIPFCLLSCLLPVQVLADDLVVFAAASLKGPLDEITANFDNVVVSYAGSGTLARQVGQGAPADVVVLANKAWMDVLVTNGDVDAPVGFMGNRLVLIGGADAESVPLTVAGVTGTLGDDKLAMGFTNSVPAGIYGREALTSLGLWDLVAPSVVEVDNVRAALTLVARNETPLGVVYQSDALSTPEVSIVATFPADSHDKIAYFAAVTSQSDNPQASAFLTALRSPGAREIFDKAGFCSDARWC